MPDSHSLLVFAVASLALIAVPGPSVVYIVTRGIGQGRRAGMVSMLGIEAGALVHVAAAAVGLSAVLASSATAFTIVKYAGVGYLVYLGVRKWRERSDEALPEPEPAGSPRLFLEGVLVNVLNPKTALFFLAFLPQFVDPARGAVALQALVLGGVFVVLAVLSDSVYAHVAGSIGDRWQSSARYRRRMSRTQGGVYIGLGAVAALSGERPA